MSVRQYIGARYVTKVYENSLDPSSAEWEANVNYEPLTMVTYNYGSYLSKKEVPASIGNPADNPTYWVQTGFYNGQIANLQNQINNLKTFNGSFRNKNLIVIGDSWVVGFTEGTGDGIVESLESMNLFKSITKYAKGGVGYLATVDGVNYDTLTDNVINDYDGHENDVHIILYIGSVNDLGHSSAEVLTASSAVYNKVRTAFPNADIYTSAGIIKGASWANWGVMEAIYQGAVGYGIIPLYWPCRLMVGNANHFTSDGYHPDHDLAVCYANNIVNNMIGYFAFPSNPKNFYHLSELDYLQDKITGFACDDTYSGLYFNNQYYAIKLHSMNFTSPSSTPTLATVKAEYMPPIASYVSEYIPSQDNAAYYMQSTIGDLIRESNNASLKNNTGEISNPLVNSSFSGELHVGNAIYTYDRLNRIWLNSTTLNN